jgi:hypothetical protein
LLALQQPEGKNTALLACSNWRNAEQIFIEHDSGESHYIFPHIALSFFCLKFMESGGHEVLHDFLPALFGLLTG